jgi:hypothetical protein
MHGYSRFPECFRRYTKSKQRIPVFNRRPAMYSPRLRLLLPVLYGGFRWASNCFF